MAISTISTVPLKKWLNFLTSTAQDVNTSGFIWKVVKLKFNFMDIQKKKKLAEVVSGYSINMQQNLRGIKKYIS